MTFGNDGRILRATYTEGKTIGADLYINRVTDSPECEKAREEFEIACDIRNKVPPTDTKQHEFMQKVVDEYWDKMYPPEGYFRDSYNNSSVLWQMGLSWWRDVIPLQDKPAEDATDEEKEKWYEEHPDNLDPQKLLDLIRPKLRAFRAKMRKLPGTHPLDYKGKPDTEYTYTKDDADYYLDKAARLVKFLSDAVENGDRINASL